MVMIMNGEVADIQSRTDRAGFLAKPDVWQTGTLTRMDRHSAAQIGQPECRPTVATVRRAKNGEKRVVLSNLEQLPVA
jgi:hypothetical protein